MLLLFNRMPRTIPRHNTNPRWGVRPAVQRRPWRVFLPRWDWRV